MYITVDRDLVTIESIPSLVDMNNHHPLSTSSAFTLQKSLLSYDDDYLTSELNNFPSCQIDAINVMLFSKIAWISSGKRISLSEAIDIYQKGDKMSRDQLEHLHLRGRITCDSDHGSGDLSVIRWKVLKNMLRKKLRLQYLAVQLSKIENRKRGTKSRTTKRNVKSLPKKMMSKSLDFSSNYSLPEINVLSKELEKSQEHQKELNCKITSNISLVSRTVPLGSLSSAFNYSKKVGGKKMYNILYIKAKGFWRIAFDRMKNNMIMRKFELVSQHFLKAYSAFRFYYAACNAVQNKTRRRLNDWKVKLNNLKTMEEYAGVVEIQRVVRGKISRIYVKNIHKHRAATKIQRYMRSFVAKIFVRKLIELKRLKLAVLFIEECWKKNIWRRTLKNLFKLRKQTLASNFIQRVYRGHCGRKIAKSKRLVIAKNFGAIKMQCLWRRYQAIVIVDEYYSRWKQVEGAIVIQKVMRGVQGRRKARIFKRNNLAAEFIQRGYRCHRARMERLNRHLNRHATKMQCAIRRKLARDRVAQMRKRRAQRMAEHARAFDIVEKMILGHARRKKYVPLIEKNKEKRLAAAWAIKIRFKAVKEGNRDREMIAHQKKHARIIIDAVQRFMFTKYLKIECAVLIQSAFRMHLAKGIIEQKREEYLMYLRQRSFYYRVKKMHQSDQEAFFGDPARKIQSCWRFFYARKKTALLRIMLARIRAAEEIQRVGMNFVRRRRAKAVANEKRKKKYREKYAAVNIQRVARGKYARDEFYKHQQANIMKWFLIEAKAISMTKGLFVNFKKRKEMLILMNAAATKIQARARGMDGRENVRRNYKKLVRNRDRLIKKRRERAAVRIQSVARRRQSLKIVDARKAEFAEQEKKRKQLEELDAKLDDLHENHLNDLLALRVQQGVRGKQARKTRELQEEKLKKERINMQEKRKLHAVSVLQGWARGVKGRKKYQEMLPELQKALRARSFCIECELAPATRKCRVCREQFCDVCFQNVHKKGKRKDHAFEYIRKGDDEVGVTDTLGANNPLMWEEQWDENAQARYWYHSITGEATWINPFD